MQKGNRSSRRNKSGQGFGKNVPIQLEGGTTASVNISDIPSSKWKHCHGIAQSTGVQVNSLTISDVGESTIIKDDTGFAASFNGNELEVAAKALLQGRGYTVNYQGQNNG